MSSTDPVYVAVRATVSLPHGMPRGREALVDATDPVIQELLEHGWLVPLDEPERWPGERDKLDDEVFGDEE